jgi:hypothetical protein
MPEIEDIKNEVMSGVDSDLDAWGSFYEKFKGDYGKIAGYEKKIEELEKELINRDAFLKGKLEREKGTLLLYTVAFILASFLFIQHITNSLDVWFEARLIYFLSGLLIGLGAFSLIYMWKR